MKRILLILCALLAGTLLRAQDTTGVARVDTTYVGKNILSVIGPLAHVSQSDPVRQALQKYISSNAEKKISGYRIRVFYNNDPSARSRSEAIVKTLEDQYPDISVYRTFESPNYKVTVGDFRTKDEALRIYNALKSSYPTSYIIKEYINYPR
ncbi:MAG: SPOR domain-containing protein [Bacteroidales bacterium]|nr:SPOR domain-containing protein [Bacteroidales bacterium]